MAEYTPRDRDEEMTDHERAEREKRRAGEPTTGGTGPGGAPTGLRQDQGWPDSTAGAAGVGSGGARPTFAGGGTGTGPSRGLGTGPLNIGGMRNLPHGAERPAGTTQHATNDVPVEVTDEGLHLSDEVQAPATDQESLSQAGHQETGPTTTTSLGGRDSG